jgi:long-subunit fatty acid transport protein
MGKKYPGFIFIASFLMLANASLYAQDAGDVLRYSLQYPEGDPVSMVMPGVSNAGGFGTYQQNPAAMALFDGSFFTFGLSDRNVHEKGDYLNNTSKYGNNQVSLGDIGFVYNFPTTQGKLTIGGGYSQSHDYNRALSGYGRNDSTTITDAYASLPRGKPLNQAAYDAYAIDDVSGTDRSKSIFRFPRSGEAYSGYPGINQRFHLTERGALGEYSFFIATELVKHLMAGVSIGVISGNYEYDRPFLEVDANNDYNSKDFIASQNDSTFDTDIDQILSKDHINDSFTSFSARLGLVYQANQHINIGASYQFKNVLHINEKFGTRIKTTMDNGVTFPGKDLGEYKYKVVRPGRLNLGITAKDIAGFTVSASAEHVAYSNAHIKFNGLENADDQNAINSEVGESLNDVFNIRAGLAYRVNDLFTPRISFARYPSPTKDVKAARQFYSAGFSAVLSEGVVFNIAAQLGTWNDQDALYSSPGHGTEVVNEKVKHWNIMGGFRFYF